MLSGRADLVGVNATGLRNGVLLVQGGVTTVDSSTFVGNRAANGGVAHVSSGALSMFNTHIEGNTAESSGGAIFALYTGSVLLGEQVGVMYSRDFVYADTSPRWVGRVPLADNFLPQPNPVCADAADG